MRALVLLAGSLPLAASACRDGGGADAGALLVELDAVPARVDPSPWPDGQYGIREISPAGIAVFDYDGDGDLDIYQIVHPPPGRDDAPAPNRLYRQEPGGRYEECAAAAGLADPGFGHGVAVGDVESDGDLDVYVANVGADALYLNAGDGTFTARREEAGIEGELFSTSAAFFDYDRDGDLDLYVCHYVREDPSRVCRIGVDEKRDYCGPNSYQGVADTLYRNDGDATFTDVSLTAGIAQEWHGFGVVCVDLTGDGWVDIYVANDEKPNQLYVNQRNGTFRDEAMERGCALNGAGKTEAGMGIAVGDTDGDLRYDLFITHLFDETSTLYVEGRRAGYFEDRSAASGLGAPSLPYTAWGCGFVDLDHDGDVDLPVLNGRVARGPVDERADCGPFWNDYASANQLFINDGSGRFTEERVGGGRFTDRVEVSRALAFGDLDGDGDVDIVTANLDNTLRVYQNDAPRAGKHWLRVRALSGKRDALGARIVVETASGRLVRPLIAAYGYVSSHEPVAHFGLGAATSIVAVEVDWPDGRRERFVGGPADRTVVLRQGSGTPLDR